MGPMPSPRVPKYQAIHAALRQRILSGEHPAGSKLPPQQEMAESFGVTLMTLRQAVAALEADGLVHTRRGRGTFVADRPVDIRFDNLSSFAGQMRAAGIAMTTEVLAVEETHATSAVAAGLDVLPGGPVVCATRRRSVDSVPFSLQRSYFAPGVVNVHEPADLEGVSLYELFESTAGLLVAEARESITAVALSAPDADALDAAAGQAAILSVRTSIAQFGRPFLFDEALLVGDRCTITADRTSDRLSLRYGVDGEAG